MSLTTPPLCDFGLKSHDFELPDIDGNDWTLQRCRGEKATLIMFICNHCPYVKAIRDRLVKDTRELLKYGIKSTAIMSNDPADYPEDSFDNMKLIARQYDYPFPYLFDEDQDIARAYGAVCTPDFFGYNADMELQYRGRLDAGNNRPAAKGTERELLNAMKLIAETGKGPKDQIPSMGCSIKWRN